MLLLALMWFLLIRPQRQRQLAQRELLEQLAVGDEILTAGGLFARVTQLADDELRAEIAPGTTIRLDRRAVAAIIPPEEPDDAAGTQSPPPVES